MGGVGRRGFPRRKVVYRGVWEGLGEIYDVFVGRNDYTTIVIAPGEHLKTRVAQTLAKFDQLRGRINLK